MEIKILGTGCSKCKTLEQMTFDAVAELDVIANISKVTDIMDIMKYGVMSTPGLVINNKVVLSGRLPSKEEIKTIILKNNG